MKTTIEIKGQIAGNFLLKNRLTTCGSEVHAGMFNTFRITYPTKKEATKALSEARKKFLLDENDFSYTRGYSISYDASYAYIID